MNPFVADAERTAFDAELNAEIIPIIPAISGWSFMIADDGLYIAPVYRGQFGCRLWRFETLGM